jgi:hypothetical protein
MGSDSSPPHHQAQLTPDEGLDNAVVVTAVVDVPTVVVQGLTAVEGGNSWKQLTCP